MAIASIGTSVKVGADFEIANVTSIGDIGGAPSDLDATTMKDKIKKNVPGVQDGGALEVEYWFDNSDASSDYRKLKALADSRAVQDIEIGIPDGAGGTVGTKFKAKALVSTKINGFKTDELIGATATFSLQSDWTVTNPTT